MSLGDFLARLHQNDGSDNHVTSSQRIREAIISILQKQRHFGEVLLQLPRENDLQLPAMMGLRWEDNRLVLVINPEKLAHVRNDEQIFFLVGYVDATQIHRQVDHCNYDISRLENTFYRRMGVRHKFDRLAEHNLAHLGHINAVQNV